MKHSINRKQKLPVLAERPEFAINGPSGRKTCRPACERFAFDKPENTKQCSHICTHTKATQFKRRPNAKRRDTYVRRQFSRPLSAHCRGCRVYKAQWWPIGRYIQPLGLIVLSTAESQRGGYRVVGESLLHSSRGIEALVRQTNNVLRLELNFRFNIFDVCSVGGLEL